MNWWEAPWWAGVQGVTSILGALGAPLTSTLVELGVCCRIEYQLDDQPNSRFIDLYTQARSPDAHRSPPRSVE